MPARVLMPDLACTHVSAAAGYFVLRNELLPVLTNTSLTGVLLHAHYAAAPQHDLGTSHSNTGVMLPLPWS
jgi:hypothetical protein